MPQPVAHAADVGPGLAGHKFVRSVAEHVTWQCVGAFDMPATLLIVKTTPMGRDSRLITFSNLQLTKATE